MEYSIINKLTTKLDSGINIPINIRELIENFGHFYLNTLTEEEQKLFSDLNSVINNKNNKIYKFYENYFDFNFDILIQLTEISADLEIDPLVQICSFKIASILKNSPIKKIKEILKIKEN